MFNDPLFDKDFLFELNQFQHKEIYAKIIVLNYDELPLEEITGRITSGSVNIDGNSTVRRTCNLSLIAKGVNFNNFYWNLGNKFTLEIGVKNFINKNYPDIIWFKQGIFVITSFNSSLTGNNYSISIDGKDKMCLLNGDLGGSLPASIDFGKIDTYDNSYDKVTIEDFSQYTANKYYIKTDKGYEISLGEFDPTKEYYLKNTLLDQQDLTIETIIREAVHVYGKEPYHNIIINDLAKRGLELLEYRGDEPLYLLYNEEAAIYDQMIPEKQASKIQILEDENGNPIYLNQCPVFNNGVDSLNKNRTIFLQEGYDVDGNYRTSEYSATKVEFGYTAGYRETDLVYPGELISSIGESLTSILDKLKNMLGAFEYFYDVEGHFIFQAKKIYTQKSWNPLIESEGNVYSVDATESSQYSYSFEDVNLISSFSSTPSLNNLKNDYSVWGVRKGASGAEIPIHSRYAIHSKPKFYTNFDGICYYSDDKYLDELKENKKNIIFHEITDRLKAFEPHYKKTLPNLLSPTKNSDGSWTPGWWDIRDWHDYYMLLCQEEPNKTMKWYSFNNSEGSIVVKDAFTEEQLINSGYSYYIDSEDVRCWLVIVSPGGTINLQHGVGVDDGSARTCTQYQSYFDSNGKLITKPVSPAVYKDFITPYQNCSDSHTYLEFLEKDIKSYGNMVYFYNPMFPDALSFGDALQNQVDKEFEEAIKEKKIIKVDWREVIYQMAKDFYKYGQEPDFAYKLSQNNLTADLSSSYYPNGLTGYEMFYADIQGFWRQLYDPNPVKTYETSGGYYSEEKIYEENNITYTKEFVWNPFTSNLNNFSCDYYLQGTEDNDDYSTKYYWWNKNVIKAPELLNFWIDFYDAESELSKYSIAVIGDRPKVVNNSKITSIYFRNIPQAIFYNKDDNIVDPEPGYTYLRLVEGMEDLFTISAQGKSAEEETNELFNQYSYCNESISITTIPVYNLEPNTLIYIHNEENKINGKYQVNRITIPLTFNGMMQIQATKIMNTIT